MPIQHTPPIQLQLSRHETPQGLTYQLLTIALTRRDRTITPQDLENLRLPAGLDTRQGVVISGRGPVWLYAYLASECYPAAWVACYEPRLIGAVVTTTRSPEVKIGQVVAREEGRGKKEEGRGIGGAVMVVGPPDSGKSVLSHALFRALVADDPDVYLQRAQWDGEGNWILELGEGATDEEREAFKLANKGGLTKRFYPNQAEAILNLRRQKSLVIVDVGGMVQPQKQPVLEACTHYIIISSKPEAVGAWHEFCRDRGNLKPLAVIHSRLEKCNIVHQQEPYVEITCGPWISGQESAMPAVLLERVRSLITNANR